MKLPQLTYKKDMPSKPLMQVHGYLNACKSMVSQTSLKTVYNSERNFGLPVTMTRKGSLGRTLVKTPYLPKYRVFSVSAVKRPACKESNK